MGIRLTFAVPFQEACVVASVTVVSLSSTNTSPGDSLLDFIAFGC